MHAASLRCQAALHRVCGTSFAAGRALPQEVCIHDAKEGAGRMRYPRQCYPVLRESCCSSWRAYPAAVCKHRQCSCRWRASAASENGSEANVGLAANEGNQEELEAAMDDFLKKQTERESGACCCSGGRVQARQCITSLCSAEKALLRLAGTLVAVPAQVVDRVVGEEAVSEEVRAVATHLVCRSALQICTLRSLSLRMCTSLSKRKAALSLNSSPGVRRLDENLMAGAAAGCQAVLPRGGAHH